MAQDVPTAEETKSLLAVSRKRALAFGLCVGKKPDTTVLILHRNKSPEILMRTAKKAGETPKVTCGKIETKGKKIRLDCTSDAPPGLAKNLRRYLNTLGLKGMSVTILDSAGTVLEEELDEEEQAAAEAQVQQEAPTEDQAPESKAADEEETPVEKTTEEQREQEPKKDIAADAQEAVAGDTAKDEQQDVAKDLARRAKDLKQIAEDIGGNSAEKLLKAIGLAALQIRAAENQRAGHMLDKIEQALKKLAVAGAQKTATDGGADQAGAGAAPGAAPEIKVKRLSSLAALEQSVDDLISEFA